ncbi:hypothetical protein A2U01_0075404 [Trifolium medium]|uniref:Uncharacterized protein n=1 Tax=Trifolium medium TaxID=97028 RepID=A0A392T1W6_9FABA|nr:hypothetical protein [Trifolium medium]
MEVANDAPKQPPDMENHDTGVDPVINVSLMKPMLNKNTSSGKEDVQLPIY